MTHEEREALPVGPTIAKKRPWTPEEIKSGKAVGRYVAWDEMPEIEATSLDDNDILFWRDQYGNSWSFGKWKNGGWYKQPMSL